MWLLEILLWFFLFSGIQSHLMHSEVLDYDDLDTDYNNGFDGLRRAFRDGLPERREHPQQCPRAFPCDIMAEPLKTIHALLIQLESLTSSYCNKGLRTARFQSPNLPPVSSDFMQLHHLSQSLDNAAFPEILPHHPPGTTKYGLKQLKPNILGQVVYPSVHTGRQYQAHKKLRTKACTSRRSGSGGEKHAAVSALPQPVPEEEKGHVTTEIIPDAVETRAEDEVESAVTIPNHDSTRLLPNYEGQEDIKVD